MVSTFKEGQNPHSAGENITGFTKPLLKSMSEPNPMLSMLQGSKESYSQLFQSLQQRGLKPSLVVSDANKGLVATSPWRFLATVQSIHAAESSTAKFC